MHKESKFMLLYNSMELIRNLFKKANEDEFAFKESSNKSKKMIQDKLKEFSSLVIDEQREEFEQQVVTYDSIIRYRSMKKQYEIFLSKNSLDLANYNTNFDELKQIRNKIFHGNSVNDIELLENSNNVLSLLIRDLLLKILTIA